MSCSTCTIAKPIPTCITNLTIGTITPDTEAIIYFRNLATNRTDFTTATSDAEGLLIVDISELSFAANQAYEMHVVESSATSIETPLEFTIGDTAYDCIQIQFKRIYNLTALQSFTDITLEVA